MITNKKIAITGENSGIGKACFDLFKRDNDVIGFSPHGTGHDLTKKIDYEFAIDYIKNCDIFINNAYPKNYRMLQVDMLNAMFDDWQHKESKAIVTIGSQAQYVTRADINHQRYATSKLMIEATVDRLKYMDHKCGIITVSPFWVRTAMYDGFIKDNPNYIAKSLLEPEEVASHINDLLELFYFKNINIYCSEIRKKLTY